MENQSAQTPQFHVEDSFMIAALKEKLSKSEEENLLLTAAFNQLLSRVNELEQMVDAMGEVVAPTARTTPKKSKKAGGPRGKQ